MGENIETLTNYTSDSISEEMRKKIFKRTLIVIIFCQIFGGAGLAAGISVGGLLIKEIIGTISISGLPTALFTLGSALTAFSVGAISQKKGRRFSLSLGFFAATIGALGVTISAYYEWIVPLFFSLFIYGAGTATNLQARYAGTDLATPLTRGRAISTAMVFTTIGAVAGPNLVEPTGKLADYLGLPTLTGPFLLAAFAYGVAGLIIAIWLKPDPLLTAQKLDLQTKKKSSDKEIILPLVFLGAFVMIITQIIMVAVMTMTPIHMIEHGHELSAVGIVIGLHIAGMYLPSLFTGYLVDRFGRNFMIVLASFTLLLSGFIAAFSPWSSLFGITVALILLGVGWNFGLISGTALIIDGSSSSTRAKVQGMTDVWIAIFGAGAGLFSGVFVAISTYGTLATVCGLIGLLLIPMLIIVNRKMRFTTT